MKRGPEACPDCHFMIPDSELRLLKDTELNMKKGYENTEHNEPVFRCTVSGHEDDVVSI